MSLRVKTLEEVTESYPDIRIYGYGRIVGMTNFLLERDFARINIIEMKRMSDTIMDSISWGAAPPNPDFWQDFYDSLRGRRDTSLREFNRYKETFLSIFAKEDFDDSDGETDEDY